MEVNENIQTLFKGRGTASEQTVRETDCDLMFELTKRNSQ